MSGSCRFSDALDQTLKHFKITGKMLSEASGVTEQALSKFRRGEREIQVNNLERIIAALPTDARNYLFFNVLIQNASMNDLSILLHAIAHEMRSATKIESTEIIENNDTKAQSELVLR